MNLKLMQISKLDLALLLQLIGLVLAVLADQYIQTKHRKLLLFIAALAFGLIVQNHVEYYLDKEKNDVLFRTIVSIIGYSIRPVLIVLLLETVNTEKKRTVFWGLAGFNTVIYLSALFSNAVFSISADNRFLRGPLGYSCHFLCAFLLGALMHESYSRYRKVRGVDAAIPLLNVIAVVAATIADWTETGIEPVSYLTVTVVSSCLFYYLWLHLHFSREHEQAVEAEQRIQIMISQIQPHFLYNTLSTIQALCRIDPEKAFETTEKFGTYLRMNIDSLNQASLIPFRQELEHTKTYADIEMMRFPYIHMSYDIREEQFELPALSVQPIVENAIRHGVRGQYNGRVRVKTNSDEEDYIVTVEDNGRGFFPESVNTLDESHIGIRNVRERIEMFCGGSMTIESNPGMGTTVTIRIPKGDKNL